MATYFGDINVGVASGTIAGLGGGAARPGSGQLWPRGSGKN